MKLLVIVLIIVFQLLSAAEWINTANRVGTNAGIEITETANDAAAIYDACGLENLLEYKVFQIAYTGYQQLDQAGNSYLTIIDYTKPSTEKRLFVVDLKNGKLLFHTLVAHGKNSGANRATSFSDKKLSLKSSPGFYLTGETYQGKHGYSLRLDGQEKGFNGNARARAIVIHGASYVSPMFIKKYHRLGRSWGCPALPVELSKEVIDTIKGGTCLYIHTDDAAYHSKSQLARSTHSN